MTGVQTVEVEGGEPRSQQRRPDIQGLRAVAVLLVVAFHAGLGVRGGFVGVDVFFVISGYVISLMLEREHRRTGRLVLRRFYARRIRRLWPALALVVVAVLLASLLLESPLGQQQATARTAVATMFAVSNVEIMRSIGGYFSAPAEANPLLSMWSLSVEEQFYLLFPFVLMAALSRRLPGRTWWISAVTAISFAACIGFSSGAVSLLGFAPETFAFFSPLTRTWEFGVGALLAICPWRPRQLRAGLLAGVGAVLVIGGALLIRDAPGFPGVVALAPVLGAAALILAGEVSPSRILTAKPMLWVGDRSYSIYLWHWPFIVFSTALWGAGSAAVAALASFIPAAASFRWLEAPIRNSRRWSVCSVLLVGLVTSIAVSMLAGLVAWGGVRAVGATQLEQDRSLVSWGRENGCLINNTNFVPSDIQRCSTTGTKGHVYLLGDSHADALSDGLLEATQQRGLGLTAVTGAGCVFSRSSPATPLVGNCDEMASALLDAIKSDPPQAVVVSHYSEGRRLATSDWPAAAAPALQELRRQRVPIIWVLTPPTFGPSDGPDVAPCRGGLINFTCDVSLRNLEQRQGDVREAEARLASSLGAIVLDPRPQFCTDSKCSATSSSGRLQYWDLSHLNRLGSSRLADSLGRALDEVVGRDK